MSAMTRLRMAWAALRGDAMVPSTGDAPALMVAPVEGMPLAPVIPAEPIDPNHAAWAFVAAERDYHDDGELQNIVADTSNREAACAAFTRLAELRARSGGDRTRLAVWRRREESRKAAFAALAEHEKETAK